MRRSEWRRTYRSWLLAPGLLIYSLFFLIPTLTSFYFSFTNWNIYTNQIQWVGFDNFKQIFDDRAMTKSLNNTLLFAVLTTIGKNVFGMALALAFNGKVKMKSLWRSVFFIPAILSPIVIGLIFTAVFHPEGILNETFKLFGLSGLSKEWLGDKHVVMYSVSAVEIWQWAGFHMALFLAGLQSIPNELMEASTVDGANRWQKFRHMTFPLILPVFNVSFIIALIGGFKAFGQIYILTGGGPGYASQVVNTMVFKALGEGRMGIGTALNLVLFLAIAFIALTLLVFLRKREVEY